MSVERAKAEISSTHFIMWCEYLAQEFNRPNRQDYYLASIAAEVRRGSMNCKHPNKVKLKDMVLKFETEEDQKTSQEADAQSKKFWFAFTGYEVEGK